MQSWIATEVRCAELEQEVRYEAPKHRTAQKDESNQRMPTCLLGERRSSRQCTAPAVARKRPPDPRADALNNPRTWIFHSHSRQHHPGSAYGGTELTHTRSRSAKRIFAQPIQYPRKGWDHCRPLGGNIP